MRAFLKTCSERATDTLSKVIDFAKNYNEAGLLLLLAVLWIPFSKFLVWYDPSAAPLDVAVLQKGYLAAIYFAGFRLFISLGDKINAPIIFRYWQGLSDQHPSFSKDFNDLEKWQKVLFTIGWRFVQLLFAGACLVAASSGI